MCSRNEVSGGMQKFMSVCSAFYSKLRWRNSGHAELSVRGSRFTLNDRADQISSDQHELQANSSWLGLVSVGRVLAMLTSCAGLNHFHAAPVEK